MAAQFSRAAVENAVRLIKDAWTLIESGGAPTAVSLAILATEECHKAQLVRFVVSARGEKEVKNAWKLLREHGAKQAPMIEQIIRHLERNPSEHRPELGNPEDMFSLFKELGLYVDMTPNGHGVDQPSKNFDGVAQTIVQICRRRVSESRPMSQRALELWLDAANEARRKRSSADLLFRNWEAAMDSEGIEF